MTVPFATARPAARHDVLAPDGSQIRFLPQVKGGSMVHCTLPPGAVSLAVTHRTVDELGTRSRAKASSGAARASARRSWH